MHTWIIYEWEKNASWWIKKSLIFPVGGAKEHLMHPTFYCFNISWLRIVSKRHQWLAIFNQPDFVALVDDSKTNRWENHRAKKKGKKRKTHRHEAFLYEGCEHVWPNGNHDVPEVQRWDGAAVGLVTLDESLSRVFQLHLLQNGEVRRKEGRQVRTLNWYYCEHMWVRHLFELPL